MTCQSPGPLPSISWHSRLYPRTDIHQKLGTPKPGVGFVSLIHSLKACQSGAGSAISFPIMPSLALVDFPPHLIPAWLPFVALRASLALVTFYPRLTAAQRRCIFLVERYLGGWQGESRSEASYGVFGYLSERPKPLFLNRLNRTKPGAG